MGRWCWTRNPAICENWNPTSWMRCERPPMARQKHQKRRISVAAIHSTSSCPHCGQSPAGQCRRVRGSIGKSVDGKKIVAEGLTERESFGQSLRSAPDRLIGQSEKGLDQRVIAREQVRANLDPGDSKRALKGLGLRSSVQQSLVRQYPARRNSMPRSLGRVGRPGKRMTGLTGPQGTFRPVHGATVERRVIATGLGLLGRAASGVGNHSEASRMRHTEQANVPISIVPHRSGARLLLLKI